MENKMENEMENKMEIKKIQHTTIKSARFLGSRLAIKRSNPPPPPNKVIDNDNDDDQPWLIHSDTYDELEAYGFIDHEIRIKKEKRQWEYLENKK